MSRDHPLSRAFILSSRVYSNQKYERRLHHRLALATGPIATGQAHALQRIVSSHRASTRARFARVATTSRPFRGKSNPPTARTSTAAKRRRVSEASHSMQQKFQIAVRLRHISTTTADDRRAALGLGVERVQRRQRHRGRRLAEPEETARGRALPITSPAAATYRQLSDVRD